METKTHKYKSSTRPVFYKNMGMPVQVDEASRKISGYLAAFGNIDDDGDMIVKGAFAKSLQERGVNSTTHRKIAYLWMHDMKEPIGKFTVLQEDEKGLYFEAEVDKIELGDRALTQYKSGTLNQHSIGFRYVWDKTEYDESLQCFVLKEVNLFEGSVVTLGANENTPFMGMKGSSLEAEGIVLQKETETFLKGLTPEQEYQARQLISKHIALAETKPPQALKEEAEPQFDIQEAIKTVHFKI